MRARVVFRSLALAAAMFAGFAVAAPDVQAQSPRGLNSNLRLVVYAGGNAVGDFRSPGVWVTAAPLVVNVRGSDGAGSSFSMGSFSSEVNYGRLRVYGSGAALFAPYAGFLNFGAWLGGAPQAEYEDRVYVSSPTLLPGTPVTLEFGLDFAGSATAVGPYAAISTSASFSAGGGGWNLVLGPTGIGSMGATHTVAVGDSFDVHGSLFVNLNDDNPNARVPYADSIACDLVATFRVTSLTPGVVLSSNSQTLAVPAAPRTAAFALAGAEPNPARGGALSIRFALPSNAPAMLALYDLAGREVARADAGALGAGSHTLDLARARSLAPGVYLARLSQGGAVRTARVAIVR